MTVKLIAYTQGVDGSTPEDILAHAFSQCYQKQPNIEIVMRHMKHKSVLEHLAFSFDIRLSRVAWDQLVRHRIASYTAQSHRYTDIQEEDLLFYIPNDIEPEDVNEWIEDMKDSHRKYKKWRSKGYTKQTARYQSPITVSIKATITFNLRSLLNLLALRTDAHAQQEIRDFAEEMWQEVKPLFPTLATKLEEEFRSGY